MNVSSAVRENGFLRLGSILLVLYCVLFWSYALRAAETVPVDRLKDILEEDGLPLEEKKARLTNLNGGFEKSWSDSILDEEGINVAVEGLRVGEPGLAQDLAGWILSASRFDRRKAEEILYGVAEDAKTPVANRIAVLDFAHIKWRKSTGLFLKGRRPESVLRAILKTDTNPEDTLIVLRSRSVAECEGCRSNLVRLVVHPDQRVGVACIESLTLNDKAPFGEFQTKLDILKWLNLDISYLWLDQEESIGRHRAWMLTEVTGVKTPDGVRPKEFWRAWWKEAEARYCAPDSQELADAQKRVCRGSHLSDGKSCMPPWVVDALTGAIASAKPELAKAIDDLFSVGMRGVERPKELSPGKFWPAWWEKNKEEYSRIYGNPLADIADKSLTLTDRMVAAARLQREFYLSETASERNAIFNVLTITLESDGDEDELRKWALRTLFFLAGNDYFPEDRNRIANSVMKWLDGNPPKDTGMLLQCLGRFGNPAENEAIKGRLLSVFRNVGEDIEIRYSALEGLAEGIRYDKPLMEEILKFAEQQEILSRDFINSENAVNSHLTAASGAKRCLGRISGRCLTESWTLEDWRKYIQSMP
ncbi:MAG TPA: hypothetical protein PL033_07315 [Candidatus Brocadiia bacterium]|nr:hypothetical protein [Candidatus Brocadiia bacterium]